jgi:hypothetical protein
MKKHHVVATIGLLALLANFLVPGLAFGQSTQQGGTLQVECPTVGTLAWSLNPADVTFVTKTSQSAGSQSSTDSIVLNDNLYPAANVLAISDTRSQDVDNCPVVQPGFTVSVSGTGLTGQGPASVDSIPGDHIYLVAGGNYSGAPSYSDSGTGVSFSAADGQGNHLASTVLNAKLVNGITDATNYPGVAGAIKMDGASYTLLQRTGPTTSVVSIGTALAIVSGIHANQYPGTYQGTITYSLAQS